MRKIYYIICLVALFSTTHTQAQVVLKALEGVNPFTPSEKCLELVYDRNYGDGDHNFIYCAVQGPNGKKWLNLNLGAEYAKESSPYFNPEAVPTSYDDWKAFGSLFQYGRRADGHELMKYYHRDVNNPYNLTDDYWWVEPVNGITGEKQHYKNSSNKFVFSSGAYVGWTDTPTYRYWWPNIDNNPCPNGYRMISGEDIYHLIRNYIYRLATDLLGNPNSTSVIHNQMFPNLYVVTAPTVIRLPEAVSGRFKTMAPMLPSPDDDAMPGGTSGIWLLPQDYQARHYNWPRFGHVWTDSEWHGIAPAYLDRGIWEGVRESYAYGTSFFPDYKLPLAASIRCIEQ